MKILHALAVSLTSQVLFPSYLTADDSWQEIKREYGRMRDDWRENYANDVRAAHKQTTLAHFQIARLDMIEAFRFLQEVAVVEAQRFRVAYLEFVHDSQSHGDDAVTKISLFNRGATQLSAARRALQNFSEVQNEIQELKGVVGNLCSPQYLKWPQDYFNAQTLFAPPMMALEQEPNFDLNYEISVSYSVKYGGGKSSTSDVDASFTMNAENQTEASIQAGLVAGGCAIGNVIPGIGCVAGVAIAQFVFSVGKFLFKSFSQMHEIFAYNQALSIIDDINKILGAGTPTRSDSDQKVEDLCSEILIKTAADQKTFYADWDSGISDIAELSVAQTGAMTQLQVAQEGRYQRVAQLLDSQLTLARSASFSINASRNLETDFEAARNWNTQVRDLAQKIILRKSERIQDPKDFWVEASRAIEDDLLIIEARTLISPKDESSYRQQTEVESKPLFRILQEISR